MLDILNLKKSGLLCGLCSCSIKAENCTPKSCSHIFHVKCLEEWADGIDSSSDFACPVSGCSSSFSEILVRKAPGAINFSVTSLKENHQCPICCERIQKPVATPESCNHAFCYMCLKEWSRVRHECPLDRGSYELILLSDRVGGPITKRVNAPPVKQQPPETPPLELDTNCEVCQRPDDEAHLLLCDHCDRGYHTYCLPTPLSSIPDGDWFCPDCIRHRVVPPDSTSNSSVSTRIRRNTRRRLIDSEAEESDNDELNTTLEESSSENLNLRHEISLAAQRRLEEQATRRHRGRRLLQDLIADLSQRVTSEASVRARRRQSQRQRVRNQLASESTNVNGSGPTRISQTTICFEIPSSTNQPVSLRLGRPPNSSSSNGRSRNHNTTQPENNEPASSVNQQEASRKRLRILSSSDSDSDEESGIALRRVKLTGHRSRLIRSPSSESSEEEFPAASSVISPTGNDEGDSNVLNSSGSHEDSTTSESSYRDSIQNSTTENIQGESDSELSEFNASYNPLVKAAPKTRKISKKKPKRRLSSKKTVRRRVKRRVVKSKTSRRTRKRRVRRKIPRLSTSLSPTTPKASTSFQPRVRNGGVIGTGLPKLSILGKETQCNFRLIVDEDNGEVPIRSPSPPCNPVATVSSVSNSSSVPQLNSRSSTYLSDIEAAQDSLFHFSTRHMHVNPDHSMSPIPVAKQSSSHNKTNTINIKTNPVSVINSPPSQCPGDTLSLIPKSPVFSNRCINAKVDCSSVQSVSIPTSCAAVPSTSYDYPNEANPPSHPSWSPESVHRVKSTLKHHLKAYISSHQIDKETCRDIFQRAWLKIVQKPSRKVTDERVAKLVDDYVQYCLRHRT